MKKQAIKYVNASELFTSTGFTELEAEFWGSELQAKHDNAEVPLVRMYKVLLEVIRMGAKDSVAFVHAAHKLPDYDPHMYVDIRN